MLCMETAQGLAFEVPLHDPADEDSLIRKHPPRRLQRLEEQPVSPPTLQELQDKLAEAQQRRLQVDLPRLHDTFYKLVTTWNRHSFFIQVVLQNRQSFWNVILLGIFLVNFLLSLSMWWNKEKLAIY